MKETITIQDFLYLLNSSAKQNVYYQYEPSIEVYRIKPHTQYIYLVDHPEIVSNSKYRVVLNDYSPLPVIFNKSRSVFNKNLSFYYSSK